MLLLSKLSYCQFMCTKRSIGTSASKLYAANRTIFSVLKVPVKKYDLVVVGGGIVGTASAREIQLRNPGLKIAILEKEKRLATHQSGNNSGVVHAGIYYKPGTLKAKLCVDGLNLSYKYFDQKRIPYKKCGKLIVATNDIEVARLMDLFERGKANNVPDIQLIDEDKIEEIEPYCRGGIKAIWSPHTGIVDWSLVTQNYGQDFQTAGGEIYLNFCVKKFEKSTDTASGEYGVQISGENVEQIIDTKYVLTCGGLHADKLAELTGAPRSPRIIPFRGEYLLLNKEKCHMIRGNIYPVPDPRFPFLGVHFTPRMDGSVWLGPNALLAFKREGYRWSDINLFELFDAIRYSGFRKLAKKYLRFGLNEMINSIWIPNQIKELQKFIPDINQFDVSRGPAGVRAQALDLDGNLVDDFVFHIGDGGDDGLAGKSGLGKLGKNVLHCRNAPSPGATSSLAIAKMIADKVEKEFQLK